MNEYAGPLETFAEEVAIGAYRPGLMVAKAKEALDYFHERGLVELPLLPRQILEIQPGDLIVLFAPGCLTVALAEMIKNYVARVLPAYQVLVLADGLELSVIRKGVSDGPARRRQA